MKRTIRPLYFDSIRPGALEGYLEHMAQRGWRLRKICCGFGLFDAAEGLLSGMRLGVSALYGAGTVSVSCG